jgi:hypothetical protein
MLDNHEETIRADGTSLSRLAWIVDDLAAEGVPLAGAIQERLEQQA